MGLLDLVFPKTCVGCGKFGNYLCDSCLQKVEYFDTQVCCECYKQAIGGGTHPYCQKRNGLDGIISLVNYKKPVRELIQQLKYRFSTTFLDEIEGKFKLDKTLVKGKNWTILPLPLHKTRQNFRGFNQAELLGKIVANKLNLGFESQILKRVIKTKPQVGLSKQERSDNVINIFKVKDNLSDQNYFIFDDVWTSGASLKAACRELKKAGAGEVWGLTLAHKR